MDERAVGDIVCDGRFQSSSSVVRCVTTRRRSSVAGCRSCHARGAADRFDGECCDAVTLLRRIGLRVLATGENLGEFRTYIIGIGCIAFPYAESLITVQSYSVYD